MQPIIQIEIKLHITQTIVIIAKCSHPLQAIVRVKNRGMTTEHRETITALIHTFFINIAIDIPVICRRNNRRNVIQQIETTIATNNVASGGYPNSKQRQERGKFSINIPPTAI